MPRARGREAGSTVIELQAMRDAFVFNHKQQGEKAGNWRAVCAERCTYGSEGGGRKRTAFTIPPAGIPGR